MTPLTVGVPAEHSEADPGTGAGRVWTSVGRVLRARGVRIEPISRRRRRFLGRRSAPDVWLAPWTIGPFEVGQPLVAVIHGASWPVEEDFFDYVPHDFAEAMIPATKAMATSADRVIVPSEYTRHGVLRGCRIPADRVHVVPHGVDCTAFHPGRNGGTDLVAAVLGRRVPYVLFASIPSVAQKNLATLKQAMAILAERGLPHALAIAGSSYDETAEERAAILAGPTALDGRVAWLGPLDDARLAAAMADCAAFCLPSLFESFGLTALEAMACGAPVVVSERGALPEVVADAALKVPPTATAIASALERVLTDHATAANLSGAGRRRAQEMTWERTADGWLSVLRQAAGEH